MQSKQEAPPQLVFDHFRFTLEGTRGPLDPDGVSRVLETECKTMEREVGVRSFQNFHQTQYDKEPQNFYNFS